MNKNNSIVKVDINRLHHNLDVIRKHLHSGVMQMAVVKADAYGHGAVEVARAIQNRVKWLAVNDLAEAVELRKAGVNAPILVFDVPYRDNSGLYTRFGLTATISAPEHFDILPPGTEYHLNVDTGMGRLGFTPGQVPGIRQKMDTARDLTCTGIYSHFATADEPGSQMAVRQFNRFKEIRAEFDVNLLTHMCNTGGSVFYPEAQFDMVRNGIGMYGYSPGTREIEMLQPALTWETHLAHVHPVSKGMPVSYGGIWEAPESGYIGVLPVGYEDGVRRNLTGELEVKIRDVKYPVVGTITMNYCMVFLREKLPVGERVVMFDGEELTASVWARCVQTIPYEILTGISGKIPRVYRME